MDNNPRSASRPTRGFAERLKEDGRQTLEQRKRSTADRVDGIAQAIERSGAQFSDNEPTLADLANRLAATVGNIATRLRDGSVDDLIGDTRTFARRNPALYIAGSVLAGFALARFVKASARRFDADDFDADELSADDLAEESLDDAPTLTDEVEAEVEIEHTRAASAKARRT